MYSSTTCPGWPQRSPARDGSYRWSCSPLRRAWVWSMVQVAAIRRHSPLESFHPGNQGCWLGRGGGRGWGEGWACACWLSVGTLLCCLIMQIEEIERPVVVRLCTSIRCLWRFHDVGKSLHFVLLDLFVHLNDCYTRTFWESRSSRTYAKAYQSLGEVQTSCHTSFEHVSMGWNGKGWDIL